MITQYSPYELCSWGQPDQQLYFDMVHSFLECGQIRVRRTCASRAVEIMCALRSGTKPRDYVVIA